MAEVTSRLRGGENVYDFRGRVVREGRCKLFVGMDRQPEKLVDLAEDVAEQKNLIGNPEYADIVQRLFSAVGLMPEMDTDSDYRRRSPADWWKKEDTPSTVHKTGCPVEARD